MIMKIENTILEAQKELSKYGINPDDFFKKRAHKLLEDIRKYYQEGEILEVGAYPFYISWMINHQGYPITGIDLGPPYETKVKKFLKNNPLNNISCNIVNENFPIRNKKYSLAIFTEVIEHISNPLKVLFEINRVLKKDGILILSTPNLYAIGKIFKYATGKGFEVEIYKNYEQEFVMGYLGHIREFSNYEIKNLLERAGFEIIKTSFEYFSLPLHATPKIRRAVIPFYLLFPRLRPFQIVIARKKKDYIHPINIVTKNKKQT